MTLWRLSAGTAGVIGQKRIKSDALPTTAYLLLGKQCRNHCRFCSQARGSRAGSGRLSRITWPACGADEAAAAIATAYAAGTLKRICLQVVDNEQSWSTTMEALQKFSVDGRKRICVSQSVACVEEAGALIAAGAEKVCLAMDAATAAVYREVKGAGWEEKWQLLHDCASALPGKIATHLMIGLGETEEQAVQFVAECTAKGITVGLFAFTPVPGTAMEGSRPPDIGHYRRVQIAHELLRRGYAPDVLRFTGGVLSGCELPDLPGLLADGRAFETSGCPDCNRPYYNERPGGVMYNYPRPLTGAETAQALAESGLVGKAYDLACS